MKRFLALGAAIVLVGAGCAAAPSADQQQPAPGAPAEQQPAAAPVPTPAAVAPAPKPAPKQEEVLVSFTKDGKFVPQNVAVHVGGKVTWTNDSNQLMWISSTGPATQSALDEKTAVAAGNSWSFTFMKEGDWLYRNLKSPFSQGKVEVTLPAAR